MFVLYLSPYGSRDREAPYLWVLYKALNHIPIDDLFIIASADYFKDPSYYERSNCWDAQEWPKWYGEYSLPSKSAIDALGKHVLPRDVFESLEPGAGSGVERFRLLLTEEFQPLSALLIEVLSDLRGRSQIEGILSWCNCPSLKSAASELGIPLIHNEFGPFRKVNYQHTAYFDFEGVNGGTQAHRDSVQFRDLASSAELPLQSREEIKDLLMELPLPESEGAVPVYDVGVPLQIEDDSNVIAFGNGFDNAAIIHEAEKTAGRGKVLVRKHPGGLRDYAIKSGDIDRSKSSYEFILKCKKILTLNSSVGLESVLLGKQTCFLGDCPFSMLSTALTDSFDPNNYEDLTYLNYLIFCYLIPYEFLFDLSYYRWRLTKPSLLDVYNFHLNYYQFINSGIDDMDFDQLKSLNPVYGNALLRVFARSRSEKREMFLRLERVVEGMESTLSWKITTPLRWGRGLLQKRFSKGNAQ